jgi:hypothetical protein
MNRNGAPAIVLRPEDVMSGLALAQSANRPGVQQNLFGHSLGGASAVYTAQIAQTLAPELRFSNLVTWDAFCFYSCHDIPDNVSYNLNLYQQYGFITGGANEAVNPALTDIRNRNMYRFNNPNVDHFNIVYSSDSAVLIHAIINAPAGTYSGTPTMPRLQ